MVAVAHALSPGMYVAHCWLDGITIESVSEDPVDAVCMATSLAARYLEKLHDLSFVSLMRSLYPSRPLPGGCDEQQRLPA